MRSILPAAVLCLLLSACATGRGSVDPLGVQAPGALAQVYYWRARPGRHEEYTRYIRDVAEKIDAIAGRDGAYLSVTTYMATDSTSPWTHMRVFVLRDTAQLQGLTDALVRAGERFEPDSAKRMKRAQYSASLRDRVGSTVLKLVR